MTDRASSARRDRRIRATGWQRDIGRLIRVISRLLGGRFRPAGFVFLLLGSVVVRLYGEEHA